MAFLGMSLTVRVMKCTSSSVFVRYVSIILPPLLMLVASTIGAAVADISKVVGVCVFWWQWEISHWIPLYYDVTNPSTMTSPTLLQWRHHSLYYDVTNASTMTSPFPLLWRYQPLYYNVTNPSTMRSPTFLLWHKMLVTEMVLVEGLGTGIEAS